jgi:hypothetical protein
MDASTHTVIKRTRTEYMNHVSNTVALDKKCITISNIKSGSSDPHDLALGAKYTSCDDYVCAVNNACPRPRTNGNGSAYFIGQPSSYMTVANNGTFHLGDDDFTIEWFMYVLPKAAGPRIFSIGSFPFADLAVSIEEGSVFLWMNRSLYYMGSIDYNNKWTHIALVRYNGSFTVFGNGVALAAPQPISATLNSDAPLILGNEIPSSDPAKMYFRGYLTNFRWVQGYAVYTTNFTVPTEPLQAIAGTKLLLTMIGNQVTDDTSGNSSVVTAIQVPWEAISPFAPFAGLEIS